MAFLRGDFINPYHTPPHSPLIPQIDSSEIVLSPKNTALGHFLTDSMTGISEVAPDPDEWFWWFKSYVLGELHKGPSVVFSEIVDEWSGIDFGGFGTFSFGKSDNKK